MKAYLFLIQLTLFISFCNAQVDTVSCNPEYFLEDLSNADSTFKLINSISLNNGDLIACGQIGANPEEKAFLLRMNADGSVRWKKSFEQTGNQWFNAMILLNDGNLAVAGNGGLLAKFSIDGTLLWNRNYEYISGDNSINLIIREDELGNLYTLGSFGEGNLSYHDVIALRKYNPAGELVFSKIIRGNGGILSDNRAEDLLISNGAAYITGKFHNWYNYSGFLAKINTATASLEWTRLYNHPNSDLDLFQILKTTSGFLLAGRTDINNSDTTVLIQTDLNGIPVVVNQIIQPASRNFERFTLDENSFLYFGTDYLDPEDNFYKLVIGKIDMSAGPVWTKKKSITGRPVRMQSVSVESQNFFYSGFIVPDLYELHNFIGKIDIRGNDQCDFQPAIADWFAGQVSVRDTILIIRDKPMHENSYQFIENNFDLNIRDICRQINICDTLNISINNIKNCFSGDTLEIDIYKNPDCTLPVKFEYGEHDIKLIRQDQSKAYFLLLRNGAITVSAVIRRECGDLRKSVIVNSLLLEHLPSLMDTAFCKAPLELKVSEGFQSYLWSTGSVSSSTIISEPGTYSVSVMDVCGMTETKNIEVAKILPAKISIGQDRDICFGDTVIFQAPGGFSNYHWISDNKFEILNVRKVSVSGSKDGTIQLTAITADGCESVDFASIKTYQPISLSIGPDTTICAGETVSFVANPGFTEYIWSSGSRTNTVIVQSAGTYSVEGISPGGCISRDTITVSHIPLPFNPLEQEYRFCPADPTIISIENPVDSYLWSTGDTGSIFTVQHPGMYTLEVSGKNGCTARFSTQVYLDKCYIGISFPNAFSPNGDGLNDQYKPVVGLELSSYDLTIYNRWGSPIFRSNNPQSGWDGRTGGKLQDSGNYIWTCVYQETGKEKRIEKGFLLLVR